MVFCVIKAGEIVLPACALWFWRTASLLVSKIFMKQEIEGRHGGVLYPQQKGMPAHSPNVGRKPNLFREAIRELADKEQVLILKGRRMVNGEPVGEPTEFAVSLPCAFGVVLKAYKQAAKGDAQARKWLTDVGWDKTVKIGNDEDSPLGGGFVLMLPENKR